MIVENHGSVRVDLLGGTLDIHPINLILKDVVTLNVATSLKAVVRIYKEDSSNIKIISKDYKKEYLYPVSEFTKENLHSDYFQEMTFLLQLLGHLKIDVEHLKGLTIELSSGAPAGSGLGGSSAMGITFMQAALDFYNIKWDKEDLLKTVIDIEARVLHCGPTGYQDYYPALLGGVLALKAGVGRISVDQLYSRELKQLLEKNITLVFSGKSRFSAINNWEVYKSFFDNDQKVCNGLSSLAELSFEAYRKIKSGSLDDLLPLVIREGKIRASLFKNIETPEMTALNEDLIKNGHSSGLKVCGAGGGGCFLIVHPGSNSNEIESYVTKHGMTKLEFSVEKPRN